jgi:hypothetical protein
MLARRLTTILPAMTLIEAIETTRIHRVAGLIGDRTALVTIRPCRAPHHTISDVGVIRRGPRAERKPGLPTGTRRRVHVSSSATLSYQVNSGHIGQTHSETARAELLALP